MTDDPSDAPIGVFDSGVGGLTVLRALEAALPRERFIYLGDTARLPYGTKSAGTVQRYALRAANVLVQRGIKALVIACNTASAVALESLAERYAPLPVFGVVEPGASAACHASRNNRIAVIATESTLRGGAYQRAILARNARARVLGRACSLLVTLAEEGWVEGQLPDQVVEAYVKRWLNCVVNPDVLLLGCTHFPILEDAFRRVLGDRICIVDSAATTAEVVANQLAGLAAGSEAQSGKVLLATDDAARFARVGRFFLGHHIEASDVEVVDL